MIEGDSLEIMRGWSGPKFDLILADPPYSEFPLINESIELAHKLCDGPIYYFMYGEDIALLNRQPEQVLYWVKPVSTKNTTKRYSRFVEVITAYNIHGLEQNQHWANRTGVFTDALMEKPDHPFGKPESLIERLLRNHNPEYVLDPFAGSGTVERVCNRLGIECLSIEKEPRYWYETVS